VLFEWDPGKAASNLRKHGVAFTEAATVFLDSLAATYPDPDHSEDEERSLTVGRSASGRILVVAHREITEDRIRMISARRADRKELYDYEEKT
jgi:uncharacterized DUF497 family protein